ncbi:hypothetical protein KKF34_03910 [Myxococcota bacterium]|nr:hypothetical protein [Myxococcota bacterium]MBU1381288.1 hypothetical protein [Myxococcota bacterium]MBU1496001.1 hypothetical protein [Myxococcota bacterium]
MWKYLNDHEKSVKTRLLEDISEKELLNLKVYHQKQIQFMQHERLIHLLVTLFMALFLLISLGFSMVVKTWTGAALCILLLILVSAYIIHYFHLENGVQRWYGLSNEIDRRLEITTEKLEKKF